MNDSTSKEKIILSLENFTFKWSRCQRNSFTVYKYSHYASLLSYQYSECAVFISVVYSGAWCRMLCFSM